MFVSWWTGIVGSFYSDRTNISSCFSALSAVFLIGRISSENDTNMSEPENVVIDLLIKTDADRNDMTNPSSTTSQEKSDGFSCFQCVNCTNEKTFLSETCDEGVTMCYVSHRNEKTKPIDLVFVSKRNWSKQSTIQSVSSIEDVQHPKLSAPFPTMLSFIKWIVSSVAQKRIATHRTNFDFPFCFFSVCFSFNERIGFASS